MSKHTEADVDLIPTTPGEVAKAIVYLAVAAATLLSTALSDGEVTPLEIVQGLIVVVGLVPVYLVAGKVPKMIAAFAAAVIQGVAVWVAAGTGLAEITMGSWLAIVISALAVIGVAVVPNSGKPGPLAVVPVSSAPVAQDMQHAIEREKHDRDVIA